MHFMPFLIRSGHISSCLSVLPSAITTITAINITITLILSFTSVSARVIGSPENVVPHHTPYFKDLQKQMIVNEFKKRILDQMGWSELPKFTGRSKNITHLRELYRNEIQEFLNSTNQEHVHESQNDIEDQDSSKALTFRLIPSDKQFKVPISRGNAKSSTTSTLIHFTRPKSLDLHDQQYSIESATLHMRIGHFLRRPLASKKPHFLVKIYLIDQKRESTSANTTSNFVLLQSFLTNPNKLSNVLKINVHSHPNLLSLLSKNSTSDNIVTFKLTITEIASPFKDRLKANTKSFIPSQNPKYSPSNIIITPSLDVTLLAPKDPAKTRSRRSAGCTNANGACCNRESIYIDFEDIGFADWVLAPQGYTAFYCRGLCPTGFKAMGAFSRIKARMHEQDPNFPAPTCAASSYAPLRVMHMGEMGTVEWNTFSDMVVTGCKCY